MTDVPLLAFTRAVRRDRRVRYVVAGALSSGTYYALFSLGWLALGGRVPYLGLVVLVNIVTAVLTYPLYRQRVFASSGPVLSGFFRYYVTSLAGVAFFFVGLPLLIEVAGVPVLVAQAGLLVALPLVNYQVFRRWAFRSR